MPRVSRRGETRNFNAMKPSKHRISFGEKITFFIRF
jgi:hypothetical protein